MSFEGPQFDIPESNLKGPEEPILESPEVGTEELSEGVELSPEEKQVAQGIGETLIEESRLLGEAEGEEIDNLELNGTNESVLSEEESMVTQADSRFLRKARTRRGFMSATIAAGVLVAMNLIGPSEANAQSRDSRRTAQRTGEMVKIGGEIYGDLEDLNQEHKKDQLRQVQREIKALERQIGGIERRVERISRPGSQGTERGLRNSVGYIDKASELKFKAQKARNAGQEDIAASYERLATQYQEAADNQGAGSVDINTQLQDLAQEKGALETQLTTARQREADLRRATNNSKAREKIVERTTRRVPRILRY